METAPALYSSEIMPPLEPTKLVQGGMGDNIKKTYADQTDSELAELATQEISLDLHGLIDDSQFPDDNLFGDLIETAKKNDGNPWINIARGGTPSSGSSGQHSPGSEGQNSPPAYGGGGYRNTLAYLPGSVHNGASGYNQIPQIQQQQQQQHHHHSHNQNIQVKQEPLESDYSNSCSQAAGSTAPYSLPAYNQATVSSSTHDQMSPGGSPVLPFSMGGPLPSLKSFSQQPKYLLQKKKSGDRSTDEYRKRRERNNVAVRKSREKAKIRTRETEERVKILARENDRLSKKVELLQEELSVLRSLFSSVGVLPDHVHRELAKHLDNFQAQHAAMNY